MPQGAIQRKKARGVKQRGQFAMITTKRRGFGGKVKNELAVIRIASIVVLAVGRHDAAGVGIQPPAEPLDFKACGAAERNYDLMKSVRVMPGSGVQRQRANGAEHGDLLEG